MPTFNLRRFCRPDALSRIEPLHLLRLLAPYGDYLARRGVVLPRVTAPSQIDHERLLKVLITPEGDTPQGLTDALFYIHAMSTAKGMDLLLSEVDVTGCKASWLGDYDPADIAVKAWLDDPEMVQRKHAELHIRDYRSFLHFRTRRRPLPAFHQPSLQKLRALDARLDDAFVQKNRGRGARVFAYPQTDKSVWYLIRHGDPYRRESAIDAGEPSSVSYRPLRFDVAIYDPAVGELRVHAKAEWEIVLYRLEFGLCLFDHMEFFSNSPKYTLEPLREKGPASLACGDVTGMKFVTLKEVHLLWGGKHKEVQIHKAGDVFDALKLRHSEMPQQPELVRATFAIRFADSIQPRLVVIAPPNTALYTREEDAQVVDQWLLLRGFIKGQEPSYHGEGDQFVLASA